jgi:hypothetical protein
VLLDEISNGQDIDTTYSAVSSVSTQHYPHQYKRGIDTVVIGWDETKDKRVRTSLGEFVKLLAKIRVEERNWSYGLFTIGGHGLGYHKVRELWRGSGEGNPNG